LPSGYEASESYIANQSLKLRVRGTDFAAVESFDVHGAFPGVKGNHWVWVVSEGNKVRIGTALISLNKNALYIIMSGNTTTNTNISVASLTTNNLSVSSAFSWSPTEVVASMSPGSFNLVSGAAQDIYLQFSAVEDAIGYYNGEITFTASDGSNNESIRLPVTVEVVSALIVTAPPITVVPSMWNESIPAGFASYKSFTICTNADTAPSSVTFAPSPGPPGSWVSGIESLGPMAKASCTNKVLILTVPAGTTNNIYSGSINVVGQGVSNAQDTISLAIQVGGDPTDITGPVVYNITVYPKKLYQDDPVVITAIASDETTGNNTIKSCQIRFDSGSWFYMTSDDGVFDEVSENVSYNYLSGLTKGPHVATIRCTDSRDNIGSEYSYSFKVFKEILFITKGAFWSGDEWDWITWIWIHHSFLGYLWNMDIVSANSVISGSIDTSYYSSVVMSDYSSSTLASNLLSYTSGGGVVVFIGKSVQDGPKDVFIVPASGNPYTESQITITDNTHFITSGYPLGDWVILVSDSQIYGVSDFIGDELATSEKFPSRLVLGVVPDRGFAIWGTTKPYRLYNGGDDISVNVIDWAIDNSTLSN